MHNLTPEADTYGCGPVHSDELVRVSNRVAWRCTDCGRVVIDESSAPLYPLPA